MVEIPQLKIKDMLPRLPIIQGGMAIKVSTAPLAAAVARNGGIGVIAGTGMSLDELRDQIRQAREASGGKGYIGVNVLYAARRFGELVQTAMQEKVDFIISGAGFSRDMYAWSKEYNVPIISIVSSLKFAKLAERLGAVAVVVEGKEAAGHLGTDRPVKELLAEIVGNVDIPVIAAGGIVDGYDIAEMIQAGADGVQMGTRFVATEECEADQKFKDLILANTKEEGTVLINSVVGLPGRSLPTKFTRKIANDVHYGIDRCRACLKDCSQRFCIFDSLEHAVEGNEELGLYFAGEKAYRVNDILPVALLMEKLEQELVQGLSNQEK